MQNQYNMRSPAVKRLMKEAQELREPTEQYHVQPLDDNLFEWHFTIRGPADSDFSAGLYHGRIILPPDYPMKPPSIILLTPNGRFEIFKKICLSISGHHPESWQPSWSIRTALLAIIGFMPTHGGGAIGSLDYTPEERKILAKKSQDWKCPNCGAIGQILSPVTQASEKTTQEAKELATQINFVAEKPKESTNSKPDKPAKNETTSTTDNKDTINSSTTPLPNNTQPSAFPWNPFMAATQHGMMPPFGIPYPMQPGTIHTMVPRFPLPCYAPAPMFPPGFNMPNMPSWTPQPTAQPTTTLNTNSGTTSPSASEVTSLANTAVNAPVLTSSSTTGSTSASPSVANSGSASPCASGSTSVSPPVANTASASPCASGSTSASPSVANNTASASPCASVSTSTSPVTSTTDVPSTESIESSITSSSPPMTNTEGLRQRRSSPQSQTFQTAELPVHPRPSGNASFVLIVILVCAIGILIARRLYIAFSAGFQ